MKTYLITGGAGFIGSHFIETVLTNTDFRIINLDKLTYAGNMENLSAVFGNKNHIFVKGDICDRQLVSKIFGEYDIDIVVNFAAESHVDRSIVDSEPFLQTNVVGTEVLLNAAVTSWSDFSDKLFFQVSTDEVYGSIDEDVFADENFPLKPGNPYAASKAAADLLVLSYANTYGVPVMISRSCNNFGTRQFSEKIIPLMIKMMVTGETLPVFGDGEQKREWIYVDENCKKLLTLIKQGEIGEIYNIGSDVVYSNISLVKKLISIYNNVTHELIGHDRIRFVKDRKGHDRRYGMDKTKSEALQKATSSIEFDKELIATVNWFIRDFTREKDAYGN